MHDDGEVFDDEVTLKVTRGRTLLSDRIIYGPMETHSEESMYKFYPEFERAAIYSVEMEFEAHGDHWVIELPMTVGVLASRWVALGGGAAGIAAPPVLARAVHIKMKRRGAPSARPDVGPASEANTGELA